MRLRRGRGMLVERCEKYVSLGVVCIFLVELSSAGIANETFVMHKVVKDTLLYLSSESIRILPCSEIVPLLPYSGP